MHAAVLAAAGRAGRCSNALPYVLEHLLWVLPHGLWGHPGDSRIYLWASREGEGSVLRVPDSPKPKFGHLCFCPSGWAAGFWQADWGWVQPGVPSPQQAAACCRSSATEVLPASPSRSLLDPGCPRCVGIAGQSAGRGHRAGLPAVTCCGGAKFCAAPQPPHDEWGVLW